MIPFYDGVSIQVAEPTSMAHPLHSGDGGAARRSDWHQRSVELAQCLVVSFRGVVERSDGTVNRFHGPVESFYRPVEQIYGPVKSFNGPVKSIYGPVISVYHAVRGLRGAAVRAGCARSGGYPHLARGYSADRSS